MVGVLVAGRQTSASVTGNDVTYICLETREVIEGPVQAVPALNPSTGRRTWCERSIRTARKNGFRPRRKKCCGGTVTR